jgi:hypothetical protein
MYVGLGAGNALLFLGYSEDGMRIQLRETFEDVHADLLGPRIPIEVQRFQADALITGDLIRWNENVLQLIEERSRAVTAWGAVARAEVGALMLAQNKCYRFLCDAPNVGMGVFPNMLAYNFPASYLHDVMERRRGARVERVHITQRALANFTNIGASALLAISQPLYNSDRTGIPGTAPN